MGARVSSAGAATDAHCGGDSRNVALGLSADAREAGRITFHERMGNPRTPEGKAQLERHSPLNSAQKIKTPLMVAQGANDPRVKRAESEQIVIALRDRGFPVEYILAPDEGHGFQRPVNSMALWASSEAFFARHLGGRAQKDMTPEVSKRLGEITVDPKTVVLAKAVDANSVGTPKPVMDLVAGTSTYQGAIAMGAQNMSMSITRTVKDDGANWIISENAKMPMGDAMDETVVEKGTLLVRKRTIRLGPVAIDLVLDDAKATGKMSMGGQEKPVSVDLGGPLFADGAGANDVLARLPLAAGYGATFRNLDVQKQKVGLKQIKVVGSESITVPAGTFDAWKAEVSSAEGDPGVTTLWIDTKSRRVLKILSTRPTGTMTAELQP